MAYKNKGLNKMKLILEIKEKANIRDVEAFQRHITNVPFIKKAYIKKDQNDISVSEPQKSMPDIRKTI